MIELSVIILISIIVLWYAMPFIRMVAMLILVIVVFVLIEALGFIVNLDGKK
jgi:hypothetical protein